ncbi:type IV secretion system protein [Sphingomonas sp. DG1-23]|uniref:type IV secretion system protein n=1 Tax=Sphingomonas sp. DG1-23 TaxID=3068316 RepID=UPI00273E9C3A|nr:type IV secretion system protein [Sphingomonas sp. DG1-23]MDP5278258.1 type IV secretion system protein [Sphingomonas sp. DG1-23]
MSCPGIIDSDFLGSVLRFADCEAQTIGMQGYQALAASGSPLGALLTGLLTILIAFLGYRMLLGHVPDGREGILTFVKIGLVLAFATSWAAYRVTIYDVVLRGPAEIVGAIGGASGLPGANGGLVARLGEVDRAMVELSRLGMTGGVPILAQPGGEPGGNTQVPPEPQYQFNYEPGTIFGSSSLGTARLVFLTATIAAYASVRLVAGLLLAIGPLFITFLLFDGTRSLFEGWVRALVAAAVGALAVTMTLGVELALLEPWLADLLSRRYVGLPSSASATELLVIGLAFAMILLGALGMAARVALGFRLPFVRARQIVERHDGATSMSSVSSVHNRATLPGEEPSRATAIAEAVAVAQRREARGLIERASPVATAAGASMQHRDTAAPAAVPLGQGHRRRGQTRVSASARKRDIKP